MPPVTPVHYLFLSMALFTIGVIGVLTRRNVIIILISIELIFNAVNINLVAFSSQFASIDGQTFAIFVIVGRGGGGGGGAGHHHRPVPKQGNRQRGRNRPDEMVMVRKRQIGEEQNGREIVAQ